MGIGLQAPAGKSSVLQALALLHQTAREHEWSTHLMLNGCSIQLGTVSDVVDKVCQIIARVRGFRDRPDCDVIVYLWDNMDAIFKKGKFPYVWNDDEANQSSIVQDIYRKRKFCK